MHQFQKMKLSLTYTADIDCISALSLREPGTSGKGKRMQRRQRTVLERKDSREDEVLKRTTQNAVNHTLISTYLRCLYGECGSD